MRVPRCTGMLLTHLTTFNAEEVVATNGPFLEVLANTMHFR